MTLSGGALMATSALPSAAKDGPALFAKRGNFERLAIRYLSLSVGATKPFSILHISDTHLTAARPDEQVSICGAAEERTATFGGMQEAALADSLAWAKENVDYVLHTGDVVDWQSEANFELVRRHFGPQVFGCMGNHEFYTYLPEEVHTWKEPFKERSWPLLGRQFPFDPRFSAKTVNGVNFVTLDDAFGTVQSDQVEKFRGEVKKGLPIVLCLHVPFFTPNIWRGTNRYWMQRGKRFVSTELMKAEGDYERQQGDPVTADFIACLKREPLLKAILAGHLHFSIEDRFSASAVQSVVGGNFMFQGVEVLFA